VLEDLQHDGPVFPVELGGAAHGRSHVGLGFDLDDEVPGVVVVRGAGDGAVKAGHLDRAASAGEAYLIYDLRDDAYGGVVGPVTGDDEDAGVVTDDHRKGDGHAGEYDGVV
jgi:hypothetical protein